LEWCCVVKVGAATKTIHEKLKQMQEESWKNNEISEKIKQTKQQEMEMLQNRWKNGMLREDLDPEPVSTAVTLFGVSPCFRLHLF